jgi:hypothetical protein
MTSLVAIPARHAMLSWQEEAGLFAGLFLLMSEGRAKSSG